VSGRNQCYALPELQQWETATTEHYVWGDPAAIQAYGKGLDTAGHDLGAIADSLTAIDVGGFWTGDAADAFTDLKRRVTPAVRGLSDLHKDSSTALNTWQQHLGVDQEDCAAAITTGRNGWHLYQTTSCDNQGRAEPDEQGQDRHHQRRVRAGTPPAAPAGPRSRRRRRRPTCRPRRAAAGRTPPDLHHARPGRHGTVRAGAGAVHRADPGRPAPAVRRPGQRQNRRPRDGAVRDRQAPWVYQN
jgi:hypothetical protein